MMKDGFLRHLHKGKILALWLTAAVLLCACAIVPAGETDEVIAAEETAQYTESSASGLQDSAAGEALEDEVIAVDEAETDIGVHSDAALSPASEEDAGIGLTVTFLDVGQGNAVIAESDGHYMLIDGGPADTSSLVVRTLKNMGVEKLDYMIATHYDADHISGLVGALNVFETGLLLLPDYETDTSIYQSFMHMYEKNGCKGHFPVPGETYALGRAAFDIVAPVDYAAEQENDRSIGIRLWYEETSFLLLGDAGYESEAEMINAGEMLDSDVYLASHHGSAWSSTEDLLEEVSPDVAVISVGKDNGYGHPAEQTLERIFDAGAKVLRTDLSGTIIAESDGEKITFSAEPMSRKKMREALTAAEAEKSVPADDSAGTDSRFIGNINSFKFHKPDCGSLPAEHNRGYFDSREEAVEAGYEPCGSCRP